MIGAGPPPKAGANGNSSGVQAGSGDGCCDTTIGRGKELMSRVPDCTSESLLEFQKLLFTFSKKTHGYFMRVLQYYFGGNFEFRSYLSYYNCIRIHGKFQDSNLLASIM